MNRSQCFAFLKTVPCRKGTAATHLSMAGGAYMIPDDQVRTFMYTYSMYLNNNKYQANAYMHLTEVVSSRFPYFVDLDILDPVDNFAMDGDDDSFSPPGINTIHKWARAITGAISECIEPEADEGENDSVRGDTEDMVEDDESEFFCPPQFGVGEGGGVIFNGINVIGERDRMSPLDCIVATAPVRKVSKSGVEYNKTGVHIVWPTFIVTKDLANVLRAIVIAALYEFDKAQRRRDRDHFSREWCELVDEAVYRNMSSLRMIGSYKSSKCLACATNEMKKKYVDYSTLLKQFQCMVANGDKRIGNAKFVAEKAAVSLARTVLQTQSFNSMRAGKDLLNSAARLLSLGETLTCPCRGHLRIPDVDAGVYSVKLVVNGDGSRNTQFEGTLASDNLIMIYAMSVRRPEGTPLTRVCLPEHSPVAYTVQIEKANKGQDDTRAMKMVKQGYPLPKIMTAARYKTKEVEGEFKREKVENFLRAGWMGNEYNRVQVRRLYYLYNIQKKPAEIDQNQDGTPYYTVIAAVEGYGSSFCHAVNRDHSSSTVYFEFTPDRRCMQKCRSSKNHLCKKASKEVTNVDYKVYVPLFPYTLRTTRVLPEEETDWLNKNLSRSYLKNFMTDKDVEMIPRTGPTFKVVMGLARTTSARKLKLSSSPMIESDVPESCVTETGSKRKRSTTRLTSMDRESSFSEFVDATF
jgi:Herpesviridae UL52/UL70 DNA primase